MRSMNMKSVLWGLGLCALAACRNASPVLVLPAIAATDEARLDAAMPELARALIDRRVRREPSPTDPPDQDLDDRFRIQLVASLPDDAAATLRVLRDRRRTTDPLLADGALAVFDIYTSARRDQAAAGSFEEAYRRAFRSALGRLDDKAAYYLLGYVRDDLAPARDDLRIALAQPARERTPGEAVALVSTYQIYEMYRATLPLLPALIAEDDARRDAVDDDLAIRTPGGATLSAMVFRRAVVRRGRRRRCASRSTPTPRATSRARPRPTATSASRPRPAASGKAPIRWRRTSTTPSTSTM